MVSSQTGTEVDTETFFDTVLPDSGMRVLAVPGAQGFQHRFFLTNKDLTKAVLHADARGLTTYYGCASYQTGTSRKADNVRAVRSLWLDIDCGEGKDYTSKAEASSELILFCKKLSLPPPMIVQSGNGLHVYWPLDADADPDEWKRVADHLKLACSVWGLKADPSRTADIASVLRPVGTTHRKGEPRPVKTVNNFIKSNSVALSSFQESLSQFCDAPEQRLAKAAPFASNSDLTGGLNQRRPSYAMEIAERCGVMKKMRDTGGRVPEPVWFAMLSIMARTEEGEPLAQQWSSGHEQYRPADTRQKYDHAAAGPGPTSCDTIRSMMPTICGACPHKVKSPILLGEPEPEPIQVFSQFGAGDPEDEPVQLAPVDFPFGYAWREYSDRPGKALHKKTRNKDGEVEWVPFCDTLFYPVARISDQEDGYVNEFEAVGREGPRRFRLPGSVIGEGSREIFATLGKEEITINARHKPMTVTYLSDWMQKLKAEQDAQTTHKHFGWDGDSFLVGETLYTPEGPRPARLRIPASKYGMMMEPQGSADTWKQIINAGYNYLGQEALQFCVLTGFAAPLYKLFDSATIKGVTVYAHSPKSGSGKSTAQTAGLSAWGLIDGEPSLKLTEGQATSNALWSHLGMLHSLPLVYDELTNLSHTDVSRMVYTISSGSERERMKSDGSRNHNNSNWCTLFVANGNMLLSEKLELHRGDPSAELYRLFEFTVSSRSRLSTYQADALFSRLSKHYGHAGREFIDYVVRNKAQVTEQLRKTQREFNERANIAQAERFWSNMCASVLVALNICRDLGILRFPVEPLTQWILQELNNNRQVHMNTVPSTEETLGRMLADLWPGIIVTETQGDLRDVNKGRAKIQWNIHGPMNGRAILGSPGERAVLYLRATAIKAWCGKQNVSAKELEKACHAAGMFIMPKQRVSLGKGTMEYSSVGQTAVECWVIDPHKIEGGATIDTLVTDLATQNGVDTSNIRKLKP